MNGTRDSTSARLVDRIAGLVGDGCNLQPLAAVVAHLRHEGKIIEFSGWSKGRSDLVPGLDHDPVSGANVHF
jgi:hypothetical protein